MNNLPSFKICVYHGDAEAK